MMASVPLWLFLLSAVGNLIFMYFTMKREALIEELLWATRRNMTMSVGRLDDCISELHHKIDNNVQALSEGK